MANRERKPSPVKRPVASSPAVTPAQPPVLNKEEENGGLDGESEKEIPLLENNENETVQESTADEKPVVKRNKKVLRKPFKINKITSLKAKTKLTKGRGVNVVVKKALLRNGRVIKKRLAKEKIEVVPLGESNSDGKTVRKKLPKKGEPGYCSIMATIEEIIAKSVAASRVRSRKPRTTVKQKIATPESIAESIENVVNDIKDVKEDKNKRKRGVSAKVKKENIDTNISVIDSLDLNVSDVKTKVDNRRHSIEKFPLGKKEASPTPAAAAPAPVLRSKRIRRSRLEIKRIVVNPYATRSDSPVRILRNGKHRHLKHLLDGLDSEYKKRRRLCSDTTKISDYESDNTSLNEIIPEIKIEENIKEEEINLNDDSSINVSMETDTSASNLTLNVSNESTENGEVTTQTEIKLESIEDDFVKEIDTNSNVFDQGAEADVETKIILDIMKQTFNDVTENLENSTKDVSNVDLSYVDMSKYDQSNVDLMTAEVSFVHVLNVAVANVGLSNDVLPKVEPKLDEVAKVEDKRTTRSSNRKSCGEITTARFYGSEKITDELVSKCKEEEELIALLSESNEMKETNELETPPIETMPVLDKMIETAHEQPQVLEPTTEEAPVLQPSTSEPKPQTKRTENHSPDNSSSSNSSLSTTTTTESEENLKIKNQILEALGLQSLQAAEEAKLKKEAKIASGTAAPYTGTLKTVIKLNRVDKRKNRPLKMTLQKKGRNGKSDDLIDGDEYKIMNDNEPGCSSWKAHSGGGGGNHSDTGGAQRKTHYNNRSNMDASSEHTSDGGEVNGLEETSTSTGKTLVIPEKASSFSVHPERLCKDECSYCFGKFGLFDTPCHIAQMKSSERAQRILSTEIHITRDSCLCDACYRHVDRKSNLATLQSNKSLKRTALVAPGPRQNHCHVLGCDSVSSNIVRRKWLMKMRKSVSQVINIDLDNPGLHSIPICELHYAALEHLMVCAMCKRRLARNHVHYLGSESNELNASLNGMGIPVKLQDRPVVCKLCRFFANLVMKSNETKTETTTHFFNEYRKRLLHFHEVELMDAQEAEEPILAPHRDLKKKKKSKSLEPPILEPQIDVKDVKNHEINLGTRPSSIESSPDYGDYPMPNLHDELNVLEKNKSDMAVQRLGSNPSISVRQLFPSEEELGLMGSIEFGNVKERTPEGWEKCVSTVQYDPETKHLWNELQKPYGNQSSFLRHLILLEKYFRNGDLILAPNATHHSINYSNSVQNRLRSYDNVETKKSPTSAPPILQPVAPQIQKTKLPPDLISLQPGTKIPVTPLKQQTQKIKFPITKNWRPNLIPIDPTKKSEKKQPGLVQVISGGKPYHITLDDYKKMCAIKRTFDLRQKRLQEVHKNSLLKKRRASPSKDDHGDHNRNAEKLEAAFNENNPIMLLPKIPKSLTVIPQTVAKTSGGTVVVRQTKS